MILPTNIIKRIKNIDNDENVYKKTFVFDFEKSSFDKFNKELRISSSETAKIFEGLSKSAEGANTSLEDYLLECYNLDKTANVNDYLTFMNKKLEQNADSWAGMKKLLADYQALGKNIADEEAQKSAAENRLTELQKTKEGFNALFDSDDSQRDDMADQLADVETKINAVNEEIKIHSDNIEKAKKSQEGMAAGISKIHTGFDKWIKLNPNGTLKDYVKWSIKQKAIAFKVAAAEAAKCFPRTKKFLLTK